MPKNAKMSSKSKIDSMFARKPKKALESEPMLPKYTYIACEGTKTEPYYIKEMAQAINTRYRNYGRGKLIEVVGVGANTLSLLKIARERVEKDMPQAETVWLVYDKDEFPNDNFDNTQTGAENSRDIRKYKVAWSNESFELWLLLHFEDISANINRKNCTKKLKKHIKDYEKNSEGVFELLKDRMPEAIRKAEKLYKEKLKEGLPPSKMCPATRVFELVRELEEYIP